MSAVESTADGSAAVADNICSRDDSSRSNFKGDLHKPRRYAFKRRIEQSFKENEKKNKFDVGNRLKESDIGITEYIGEHTGFSAIIKERYTDFHVNEIDLNGQVAKLTHQDIPLELEDDENIEDLKKLIPSVIWDQLEALKEDDSSLSSGVEIDVTNLDKSERKAIHLIAKKLLNVISLTENKDDRKFITIVHNNKNNETAKKIRRRDNRIDWKGRGEYCHFLMHKVNMDTMDALNRLAANSRIRPNRFRYAGTKDRRACTTQWVCLRKIDARDILKIARPVHGLYVGNFKYVKECLSLGMLNGNRFRIALRNVQGSDQEIKQAMTSIRERGFINYYGLQRFGSVPTIPTHNIGKCLLQGKWHEAIELILKPREREQNKELAEARRIYVETKDPHAAYAKIKRLDTIEAILLKSLKKSCNKNPIGALDSLPRNIRLMYIHAYQSYVWNHIVSKRMKQFGANVIVGDLVYDNQNYKEDVINETIDYLPDDTDIKDDSESTSIKEKIIDSTAEKESEESHISEQIKATNEEQEQLESTYNLPTVKVLTEENLSNYTLFDVVMPQPGWKVTYPSYAKSWYDDFLGQDELTTDLRSKIKKYSLGGSYRKILGIPTNLSWKIVHYNEKHDDLILSDINEMRKREPLAHKLDGQHKALIMEMDLQSSNYATMALREILKTDTSAETQATLSASLCRKFAQSDETTAETITDKCSNADSTKFQRDNTEMNCEDCASAKEDVTLELDEADITKP